ncbi:cyclic nucleotide-gated cation channel subunit a [Holotrichia oblita]|uniref:Cyclic nucleotide-gated cation channel subunit a n=1 Tax=Holotrichia oblita TaxID=644536 RepID=A0ACB9TM66_HOLOL|nr:cyclic nucleotide-gated cation channel subunit a [Holotrichia oblita]
MNFTQSRAVSFPIVREISEYIQLLWVHHRGIHVPQLLEEAPIYLKEATMNAMFGYHLRQHPIMKKCHVDLIRQMATEMQLLVFFPNNHITYQGDIDHCMYFIHEGVVDVLCRDSLQVEVVVKTLIAGDSFGLIQCLHPRKGQKFTYKVRQHAIINVLQREKWIHKLVFFPASKSILDECLAAADRGTEFD